MPGVQVGTVESPNEGPGTGKRRRGQAGMTFRLELASPGDHLEVESKMEELKETPRLPA